MNRRSIDSNIHLKFSFFEDYLSMKLKSVFVHLLLILCMCRAFPQKPAQANVMAYKDSLNNLAKVMQRGATDSARFASASVYYSIINFLLSDSASFNASFDSIPNLSVKTSPDHVVRLYTWTTSNYEGSSYRYFGFLQVRKNKKTSLFPLTDSTDVIEQPMSKKLKAEKWLGAIYYSILVNERKGKKIYTLLGWKGKNEMFTQKLIDVLTIENNKPVFGLAVFKANNIYHHRVMFEYTSQDVMSLKSANDKMLVFDHIGKSTITGVIGPDGTYDAFKYMKDHWEFLEDVDVDNGFVPRKKEVKLFKDDELKK
jgi:hypothetical protein